MAHVLERNRLCFVGNRVLILFLQRAIGSRQEFAGQGGLRRRHRWRGSRTATRRPLLTLDSVTPHEHIILVPTITILDLLVIEYCGV